MRIRFLVAAVTVGACGVVVPVVVSGMTGSASATSQGEEPRPSATARAETPRHCVVYPDSTERRCFDTYRDAIAFASRGEITDAPPDAAVALRDQRFLDKMTTLTTREPAGGSEVSTLDDPPPSWVIGATVFAGTNYTGDSATLYVPRPCAKDGKYDRYYENLNVSGDIESLQAWAGCWVWLHDSKDWNGDRMGPYKGQTPDLGDWKNRGVMVGLS